MLICRSNVRAHTQGEKSHLYVKEMSNDENHFYKSFYDMRRKLSINFYYIFEKYLRDISGIRSFSLTRTMSHHGPLPPSKCTRTQHGHKQAAADAISAGFVELWWGQEASPSS